MQWRTKAAIGAFLLGSGMAGCDCVGCTSKEVARAEGEGWSVKLACEANTRLGGVGAGHAGGILYPDGCDVGWEVRVDGKLGDVKASLGGPSIATHACSEVRTFCKTAKGTVVTRTEGADVVAVASTGEQALGFYILSPGQPFRWPSQGVAGNTESWKGAIGPAVEAGRAGDGPRLLAAMPAGDLLITQMLTDALPLEERMLSALEGPRLDRHLAEVRAAIGRCVIPAKTMERVASARPEAIDDIYTAALPRDPSARGCPEASSWLRTSPPKAVAPRVVADLRACGARCPSERLETLALLADGLASKEGATLLIPHLTAPRDEAWEKDEDGVVSAYTAWFAAAYTVAHLDPASARGPLLAQFSAQSTRRFHFEGNDDDDADASPKIPGGVDQHDFPLEKPTSGSITGGNGAGTLRDMAELLLVADEPSVHDALFALARDPKKDRGVRQVAIAFLLAVHDPRADALFDEPGVLTTGQRKTLRPPPPPAPAGSGASSTSSPSRSGGRRHHHH